MKAPLKLGVASIRRSSNKQEGNNSFELQTIAIKEFAQRKGFYIPDEFFFVDDGVSAYKKKSSERKGLNNMKKVILENDILGIFFYDSSRIDRKIYSFVTEFYMDVIKTKPFLEFYTTTKEEKWNPNDIDVKLHLIIANAESNEKSRRTIDKQVTNLNELKPKRPGSVVPFGYNQSEKVLTKNEESSIVLFIFFLASWGHSVDKIANILNDAKITSPKKGTWRGSTIDNILKNPVYLGHLNWNFKKKLDKNDYLIKNNHKPIVPAILLHLIDVNRNLKKLYSKLDTPFLFTGLLKCKQCGERLKQRNSSTKKQGKRYDYLKYYCRTCSYTIDALHTNKVLIESIQKQFSISIQINHSTVTSFIENAIDSLKQEKEKLQARLDVILANQKYISAISEENLSSIFRNASNKVNEQLDLLQDSIAHLKSLTEPEEMDIFLSQFNNIELARFSHTEQRVLFLYFINEIVVDGRENNVSDFHIEFKTNPVSVLAR